MDTKQIEADWTPRVLGLLRIVTALLFMMHGSQKLLGLPASTHSPELFSLIWFAGFLELVGGFLVLIGLFTRPVAFVLSGQMAFAYWMAHAPKSVFPGAQRGRCSNPLLLHLSLSRFCRPRSVQRRWLPETIGTRLRARVYPEVSVRLLTWAQPPRSIVVALALLGDRSG